MPRNISRKDAKALSFPGGFAPLREIAFFLLWLLVFVGVANAQQKPVPVDANKFVLIINGPGGEAAYAHQFEEWTEQLRSSLAEKFGFDRRNIRVLSEKGNARA